jgi:hypothetical protein
LRDGANNYVYGPSGSLVEVVAAGATTYAFTDYLRSPRVLTDATGTVTAAITFTPTGTLHSQTGGTPLSIGLTGGYTTDRRSSTSFTATTTPQGHRRRHKERC